MKTGSKYGEKEKIQILIKSLIFCILRIYIFSFYAFLFFRSLADAELREYGFEDLFRDDVLPGDAAQMADDLTDLFAQQVGRKVVAQAVEGGAQGFGRRRQGFVMAAVGDDRAAVVERFRIDRVAQDPAQVVDAVAVACRDADGAFGKCESGRFVDFVVYRQQRLVGTERKVRAWGVGGRIGARNCRGGLPARLSG